MFKDALIALGTIKVKATEARPRHNRWVASLPLRWRFYKSGLYISPLAPFALGFGAGILTMLLGVGGGFILVPAMIYLLGMPARVVIGTSLAIIIAIARGRRWCTRSPPARWTSFSPDFAHRRRGRRAIWRDARDETEAGPSPLCAGDRHPARRRTHGPRPRLAPGRNLHGGISVRRIRAAVLALVALAIMAQAKPVLVPDVSARRIEIRYSFTGAQLLLFGAILYPRGVIPERTPDIAVVLRGPVEPILVREKQKVAGIWMNAEFPLPVRALLLCRRLVETDQGPPR